MITVTHPTSLFAPEPSFDTPDSLPTPRSDDSGDLDILCLSDLPIVLTREIEIEVRIDAPAQDLSK